jgi:hypothetical protein
MAANEAIPALSRDMRRAEWMSARRAAQEVRMTDANGAQAGDVTSEGHTVQVYVIAESGPTPGSVTFKLDSDLTDDKDELVFDQDRDDMRKLDYYLIEFNLVDRTGLRLQFAPSKQDAFWVIMGSDDTTSPPCPKAPSYSDEIYAIDVDKDKLTVRNENNTIAKFAYSLGFVKGDGSAVRMDPVGTNKDGGKA